MKIIKPITQEQIEHLTNMRMKILAVIREECKVLEVADHHVLSMLAYTLGQTIAFQDQTRFTAETIMALVDANIEAGNRDAILQTFGGTTGAKQ